MTIASKAKNQVEKGVSAAGDRLSKARARMEGETDKLLGSLSEKVSDARVALADWTEDSADNTRAALAQAVKKSKRGIRDLDRRWKKMSTGQKAAVVGGLLAALAAAAAAPKVIRKVRGK